MSDSDRLTRDPRREIIQSFADEIGKDKVGVPGEARVIPFRTDKAINKARPVYYVSTELLRFRKENGRIASDVESYEKFTATINETSDTDQQNLRGFLEEKDPEKTETLMRSLNHEGQNEPAVITADGFLINGNRRKMALEKLQATTHDPTKFAKMKVVILPGPADEGGEPTNKEIELLENAYQFHQDGKSEYYNFDRAVSIRRKIRDGLSLEEQLRSDSRYANLNEKKFDQELKRYYNEFLGPLECIDEYLEHIGRPGDYRAISGGRGDPDGRWQAFLDYYKAVGSRLKDVKARIGMEVEEYEVGAIKDAAFKILRQRTFGGKNNDFVPNKINDVMRQLPKVLSNPTAKKELLKLKKVPLGEGMEDGDWVNENHKVVSNHVTEAFRLVKSQDDREKPIDKLERALGILNSEDIDPQNVPISNLPEGLKIINALKERVEELKDEFWRAQKNSHNTLENFRRNK